MKDMGRLVAAVSLLFLGSLPAHAVTISDIATGTGDPPDVLFPAVSVDGDFTYAGNAIAVNVGDGNDETVTWTFDFTGDPDYPAFTGPLASALLTLTLKPVNGLITTDVVGIAGLPNIVTPVIQGLPVGVTSTIVLDLLGSYSSADILGVLGANAGSLPMVYADDALLAYAELDLAEVPEPGSLLLLGTGLFALASRVGRRR